MIDRCPIIINNEIIGFRKELIHIFNMEKRDGKTQRIINNIYEDEGHLKSICINVKRNEYLTNKIKSIFIKGCQYAFKSDIKKLEGEKIHVLYVDEWFYLPEKDREWIINWCKNNNTYLNAYGTLKEE